MARQTRTRDPREENVQEPQPEAMTAGPSQEDIARRAYELYERRGSEPGRELDDWFEAERELNSTT